MRFKTIGNKRDIVAVVVKNADTLAIRRGAPVFLAANGTDNGLAVISANNLAVALQSPFFGLATADIAVGAFGEAQIFGFMDEARVILTTRGATAATSDVWVSYPAGVIGAALSPGTGTGHVAASVSADQAMIIGATQAFTADRMALLMETYASATTQSSTLLGSATASTAYKKVMIRAL